MTENQDWAFYFIFLAVTLLWVVIIVAGYLYSEQLKHVRQREREEHYGRIRK